MALVNRTTRKDWRDLGAYDGRCGADPHGPDRFPTPAAEEAYMEGYRAGELRAAFNREVRSAGQRRQSNSVSRYGGAIVR